jgi:hypothetical protein
MRLIHSLTVSIALVRSFLTSKGQYPHVAPKVIGMMKASGFNMVYDRMIEVPIGKRSARSQMIARYQQTSSNHTLASF